MMNRGNRRIRETNQQKLVFIEGRNPGFDLKDLLRSSSEGLGMGAFGTSYKAAMDNGITVVMKRLMRVSVSNEEFRQHMEVIGRMRHGNVDALISFYCSRDENLTLYDYHDRGSASDMLYGKRSKNQVSLDWETRLRIAVGVARGIAHIHMQAGQKLVHGNVKASNIFINAQGDGCVSDIGFATLTSQFTLPVSAGY
ncbi:putative inactive receptor kinase [Forsythia ovata]|uniref:Inactive receptor kinase n=1 Tax=Forsythia ovata TaxID=205694 RepID=A0ABD1X9P8_9LAMI